jgi:hypothetical protein
MSACVERSGISDFSAVDRVRNRLLGALECQLFNQHPLQPGLFNLAVSFLPHLHSLGSAHYAQLGCYRAHWQHLSNLPPLYAELFDIPVSPEDEENEAGGIIFAEEPGL